MSKRKPEADIGLPSKKQRRESTLLDIVSRYVLPDLANIVLCYVFEDPYEAISFGVNPGKQSEFNSMIAADICIRTDNISLMRVCLGRMGQDVSQSNVIELIEHSMEYNCIDFVRVIVAKFSGLLDEYVPLLRIKESKKLYDDHVGVWFDASILLHDSLGDKRWVNELRVLFDYLDQPIVPSIMNEAAKSGDLETLLEGMRDYPKATAKALRMAFKLGHNHIVKHFVESNILTQLDCDELVSAALECNDAGQVAFLFALLRKHDEQCDWKFGKYYYGRGFVSLNHFRYCMELINKEFGYTCAPGWFWDFMVNHANLPTLVQATRSYMIDRHIGMRMAQRTQPPPTTTSY